MLDQSFSPQNFDIIFDIENRKGNIHDYLDDDYKDCLSEIKALRNEFRCIINKKKSSRTLKESDRLHEIDNLINDLVEKKKIIRQKDLAKVSKIVNSSKFRLKFSQKADGNYTLTKSKEAFYAIKQLQNNIRKTFSVKQSSRHKILSQIKLLLNDNFPKYIIRTDIAAFYESIPQEKLLSKIESNTLLNVQAKTFIRQILEDYDNLKDQSKYELLQGIPRGIGISSYLSELYMKDIDKEIKKIPEIIYYARYVDDIFIIISPKTEQKSIENYYSELKDIVLKYDLALKPDGDEKCTLLDLTSNRIKVITYLGYDIHIEKRSHKNNDGKEIITCTAKFDLSKKKKDKIKSRILRCIDYYNVTCRYDINSARKNMLLCLQFLSKNAQMRGMKKGVKVGIYYSNDLLDEEYYKSITALNGYLKGQLRLLNPHMNLFNSNEEWLAYLSRFKQSVIEDIDFISGYKNKIYHNFSINDMRTIKRIWQ